MNSPHPLPHWPSHPRRSRIRGWIWKTLGVISWSMILLWPVMFAMAGWIEPGDVGAMRGGFELGVLFFGLVGVKCYMRGKRHLAIAATELLSRDTRPPVIYLRSFQHDKKGSGSAAGSRVWGGWAALFDLKTIEERLAEALTPIGPVIAIGKPGEKLPALGAARLYVGDDEWQDTIRTLMGRAKLVVLLLGDTPGFWWELERSVKELPPERLALIVPFRKKRYDAFREQAASHFAHALPDYSTRRGWLLPVVLVALALAAAAPFGTDAMTGAATLAGLVSLGFRPRRGLGRLSGLIYFRPDWTPEWIDLTTIKPAKGLRRHFYGHNRLHRSLTWNMRPVFAQLGLEWSPPKVRRGYIAAVGAVAGVVALAMAGSVSAMLPEWKARRARERLREAFVTRFQQSPDVIAQMGAIGNRWEANEQARRMAAGGILRLSDAAIIERQRIIGDVWAESASGCMGALIDGGDPLPDSRLEFQSLQINEAWYRILGDAAIAQVRQTPWRAPTASQIQAAFAHVWPRYGSEVPNDVLYVVRERTQSAPMREFLSALPLYEPFGFVQVYEADACRGFGELNRKAATLPPPHNGVLARALASAMP